MKKVVLSAVLLLSVLAASAEIKFCSLDNIKGTNIVLVDKDSPADVEVTDAVFINGGKEYKAKNIRCDVVGKTATYKLKFKRHTVFRDCKVILTVNGKKKEINIQKSLR